MKTFQQFLNESLTDLDNKLNSIIELSLKNMGAKNERSAVTADQLYKHVLDEYILKISRDEFMAKLTMKLISEPNSKIIGKRVVGKGWLFWVTQITNPED